MLETKILRKKIYDFVKEKGAILSDKDMGVLSELIQDHSDARIENLKEITTKTSFANDKISAYLKKAGNNPLYAKEKATLILVSSWLNKGGE